MYPAPPRKPAPCSFSSAFPGQISCHRFNSLCNVPGLHLKAASASPGSCRHLKPRRSRQGSTCLPRYAAGPAGRRKTPAVAAASTSGSGSSPNSRADDDIPKEGLVSRLLRPLKDFGFGRKSFWEGGVGLFIFAGVGFALVLISWAKDGQLGRKGRGYECVLEFPLACGISTGTPVRIRGVPVGSVMRVQPSLERVDVFCEIKDQHTAIPRNSKILANQSGLIAEPLIDITPQTPIPQYEAGPTDPECEHEGKIVCHNGHIVGEPGVAMDDLVYICTKLARQMDADGLDRVFEAAQAATLAIEDGRPLLDRAIQLADEVTPLMTELRQGGLVSNIEELTRSASEAAGDIRRLQHEVLTSENVRALRDSIITLTRTMEHIEGISGDVGGLTGDTKVKAHVRQLVEALSRIVAD